MESQAQNISLQNVADGKSLAVRSARADVAIDGPIARTRLCVTFSNDLGGEVPIEADLVFPVPPFASLAKMTVKVGQREIEGKFKARDRAQADYGRAKQAGQTTALAESEGEDLARLRITPIEANEDVEAVVEVVHPLISMVDGHRLIVPLTYMPRFVEDRSTLKPTESAAVDRPRPLTLAARATAEIRVRSLSGKAAFVRCATHAVQILDESGETVVHMSSEPLDHDLVVEIMDKLEGEDPTVWIRHDQSACADGGGPATVIGIVPPKFADECKAIPRDVILLVDHSGSMDRGPLDAAKRAAKGCLRALGDTDRFNIIAFDDKVEALAPTSVEFGEGALKDADAFIDALQADGGTRASRAIEAALANASAFGSVQLKEGAAPDPNLRLRILLLLTDGDVSSCEDVIRAARDKLHDTRIFVVGIGVAVAHANLAALAELGRGTYVPSGLEVEDLEKVVARIKASIDAPLITGIKVRIDEGGEVRDAPLPESAGAIDLFAGDPLLIAFRGPVKAGAFFVLSGQRASGEEFRLRVRIPLDVQGDCKVAGVLWAMLRNKRLTYRFDSKDDATLEELGVAFGLVNRRTALVGVHEDLRGLKALETVPVVLPMPRNIAQATQQGNSGNSLGVRSAVRGASPGMQSLSSQRFSSHSPLEKSVQRSRVMDSTTMRDASLSMGMSFEKSTMALDRTMTRDSSFEGNDTSANVDTGLSWGKVDDSMNRHTSKRSPARFTDSEAELRALMLTQGVDGRFGKTLMATLAAVMAFAKHGHTARSGNFKAELRRTLAKAVAIPASGLSADDCRAIMIIRALLCEEQKLSDIVYLNAVEKLFGGDSQAQATYMTFLK